MNKCGEVDWFGLDLDPISTPSLGLYYPLVTVWFLIKVVLTAALE